MKLPKHHSSSPRSLLHCLTNRTCQISLVHPASVRSIKRGHRLANNNHLQRNPPRIDLLHRGIRKRSNRLNKQSIISIIGIIPLIIELDIVEIYQMPNLLMHGHVSSIFVMLTTKIRSLRSMGNNVGWKHLSQLFCEGDYPSLAQPFVHCGVVLPIDISAIEIIQQYKISQFSRALDRVIPLCRGKFSCTKGTDQNTHTVLVIFIPQCLLNFIITTPKRIIGP